MRKVHFIGVCGSAMATLAVLLKQRGLDVVGSDEHVYPPMSEYLESHEVTLLSGYRAEHITDDIDLVVIGNAVSRGNPEVEAVLNRKVRYASLPEVVKAEFLWDRRPIVVAGTHGKTTTAFMLAWILTETGRDPSFLIGGISQNLETSGRLGTGDVFVVEGDEYDSAFFDKSAKFLKYLPEVVVVNNLEFDHADIYRDLDELRRMFRRLVRLIPSQGRLIVCADDPEARALVDGAPCVVETFGFDPSATWGAKDVTYGVNGTTFDVVHDGAVIGRVVLPLLGAFNVKNALAALAAAAAVGSSGDPVTSALDSFRGVKRRLEVRGVAAGVTVYDDFAHHPTAVRETLEAMQAPGRTGRVWAIFEPRSATACRRIFQKDFAASLGLADEVVVAAVYRSSLPEAERLSERELVDELTAGGVSARFLPAVDDVVTLVAEKAVPGDHVVVMSNGAFGGIHDRLLQSLDDRS